MGLILAGAYLGGGLAEAASQEARAAAPASQAVQTAAQAAPAASVPETIRRQGARSGELLKASFAGPAAAPFKLDSASDLDCLTEAVYYEARGEGSAGQRAVAQVILNRVRHPSFPKSVCAVVYQGCQFSFSCNGAMRARREAGAWNRARGVATEALSGAVMASVGNATHFHTIHVSPKWGPRLLRVGQVGLHVFYRFKGRNGGPGAFSAEPVGSDSNEPGKFEYARLTPEERQPKIYMMSATVQPQVEVAPGMGGPLGKPQEPASAPAAKPVAKPAVAAAPAAQPAVAGVKVSAPITPSKTTSAAAS